MNHFDNWYESFDGGSALRKTSTHTGQHNTEIQRQKSKLNLRSQQPSNKGPRPQTAWPLGPANILNQNRNLYHILSILIGSLTSGPEAGLMSRSEQVMLRLLEALTEE
jgi:hypothetical protein